jgi:TorA maturation chaperone TorD
VVTEFERWDALAAAFATLGSLHRGPPDEARLAAFEGLLDEWPLPETDEARLGAERVRRSRELGEDAEAIRRDHDRLYGVSATAQVAPYESVHRGVDRLVFDTHTLDVRRAYEALGLRAPKLHREPDDHIGLEFDFIAQALLMALDAVDAGRDAGGTILIARSFLHEHLLSWCPVMLDEVVLRAKSEFMAGVALLSQGALRSAAATLR